MITIKHNTEHIDHLLGRSPEGDCPHTIHCEICGEDIAVVANEDPKVTKIKMTVGHRDFGSEDRMAIDKTKPIIHLTLEVEGSLVMSPPELVRNMCREIGSKHLAWDGRRFNSTSTTVLIDPYPVPEKWKDGEVEVDHAGDLVDAVSSELGVGTVAEGRYKCALLRAQEILKRSTHYE